MADRTLAVAAAWLHDIGYAPDLASTGFHPLDGARFLQRDGWETRLCGLVAHHSCASFEAEERGMTGALEEWPRDEGPVADVLTAADMTTGPTGERCTVEQRLTEILDRYRRDSPVHRAILRATPSLTAAVERAERRQVHPR
jgi:hypothetical protein